MDRRSVWDHFFQTDLFVGRGVMLLTPLRVNLVLILVFIGAKSLPFNAFSLKSLQISLGWFSRNRLKMADPFCLLVKRPSAVMSEEKRLPFAGWEEERPGGGDKKTMVVLLVFIYDYFGGSFWSEKKKNCWTQKVNLAVTFSKILLDVLLDMYILGRVLLKGAGPEYEFENQSPTIYH